MKRQIHVLRMNAGKALAFTVYDRQGKILRRGKIKAGGISYRQGEECLWSFDDAIESKVVFTWRKYVSKPILLCAYLPDLKIRIRKKRFSSTFMFTG